MEKILNQSITDATLGLSDVKRYRDAADSAKADTVDLPKNEGNILPPAILSFDGE